jgi:hypothetical protein
MIPTLNAVIAAINTKNGKKIACQVGITLFQTNRAMTNRNEIKKSTKHSIKMLIGNIKRGK